MNTLFHYTIPFSGIKAHLDAHLADLTPCLPLSATAKNPATWQVGDEEAKGESSGLSVRL